MFGDGGREKGMERGREKGSKKGRGKREWEGERGREKVRGRLDFLPYELETCLLSTTLIKVDV